jgi:hypothetical protein
MQEVVNQSQFLIGQLAISFYQLLARQNKCMIPLRLVRQESFAGVEVLSKERAYRGILGGIGHGTTAFLTNGGGRPSIGRRQIVCEK